MFQSNHFSCTEILQMIYVYVAEEDESFHMIRMELNELTEEWFSLERSIVIGE